MALVVSLMYGYSHKKVVIVINFFSKFHKKKFCLVTSDCLLLFLNLYAIFTVPQDYASSTFPQIWAGKTNIFNNKKD